MFTNLQIPNSDPNAVILESHSVENNKTHTLTNQSALSKCLEYSSDLGLNYENVINTCPIFNPANLFLGFLGAVNSNAYSSFSGSNKMTDLFSLFTSQNASTFICERDLLNVQLPDVIIKFFYSQE